VQRSGRRCIRRRMHNFQHSVFRNPMPFGASKALFKWFRRRRSIPQL
jgi:hypothetical protein